MAFGGAQAVVGSFAARLGLDTEDYARGIINAQGVTRIFGETFAQFVSNPVLGAIDLFRKLGQSVLGVVDAAEAVSVLAQEINASTDFVQALKAQYEAAGQSFESSIPILREIVKTIKEARDPSSAAAEAMAEIGVSLDGVTDTGEAIARIVDGLSRVESVSDRTALAFRTLSERSGGEFLAVVGASAGAIDRMVQSAKDFGQVIDGDALGAVNTLDGVLDDLNRTVEGVGLTAISKFIEGFVTSTNAGEAGVVNLAKTLNEQMAQVALDLGTFTGQAVGELDKIVDRLTSIAELIDTISIAWDNKIFNTAGSGLQWMATPFTGEFFDANLWRGLVIESQRMGGGQDAVDRATERMSWRMGSAR